MIVQKIEEIKKMNMPPLNKDDIMEHLFKFIGTELWLLDNCEPTPFAVGKIRAYSDMIDVMCTISARCGLTLNIDGHSIVHQRKKMELLRKIGNTKT